MSLMVRGAATLTRVVTFPLLAPAWLLERLARRLVQAWAFDPYSSTPYFMGLAVVAWYAVFAGPAYLGSIGLYLLSCLELLALWLCAAIVTGHRGAVFDELKRVMWWTSREIRTTPTFDARSFYMSVGAYLYSAVYFSSVHTFIYRSMPDAYHGIRETSALDLAGQFLYFSVVTVATVGYGDIYPTHWLSRAAAVSEILVGLFFGFFLFSAFVSSFIGRLGDGKAE